MYYIIGIDQPRHPATRVLVWRDDTHQWEIRKWNDFSHHIGHEALAYTRWMYLPPDVPKGYE